ncbi:MAG: hypothetical protein GX540_03165 [Clostridiales bacterium]|nr:hypothetical protein [Clostridiales bacterium]
MPRTEVFALADELMLLIKNAKKIPLTDTAMVNQNAGIDLVKRIISAYDPQLDAAQKIVDNEEHIIMDAQHKADEAMKDAQNQAQGMVTEANAYAQTTKQNADSYYADLRAKAEEESNAVLADAQARAQNMIEDARAQADELVSKTTVLARAEAQAQELLDNANQHAQALRSQTQQELGSLLEHIDANLAAQLNDLRAIRQNVAGPQQPYEDMEEQ